MRVATRTTPHRARSQGMALLEFALVIPVMLFLLAGTLNYSLLLRHASSVSNAARSGALYGSRSLANSTDTGGIQAAAVNSVPGLKGLAVTSARTCRCSDGAPVDCSGTCTGGRLAVYVQVTTSAAVTGLLNYSGIPSSGQSSATAVMRAQ